MSLAGKFQHALARLLIRSTRIHLRIDPAPSTADLVALMDRFVDRTPRYDLEWDDFISWESQNAHVEAVRRRLEEHELLLFSKKLSEKRDYRNRVITERNRLAALLGLPLRDELPEDWTLPPYRPLGLK